MKRILAVLLAVIMCAAAFAGCGEKKVLKVGVTVYEPMNYKDEAGNWTGFDTEFAEKAAADMGYDSVEFIVIEWDNKFFELESGAIDCIWNGMTITDEAKANADVSAPYVYNSQVVVMAAANKDSYNADNLAALTFAVEAGGAAADILDEKEITYTAVSDQAAALLEVNSGSSQACIIDITMANSMLGEGTNYSALTVVDSLSEEEYGIAVKKGSELKAKLDDLIAKYKTDGTFEALAKKYDLTIAD